jgi:hypothetical protein
LLAACKNGHSDAHIGAVRLLCRHGAERRGLVDGVGCSAEAVCRHFGHQQLLDWLCQSRGWSVLSKDVVRAAEDEDYEARQAELARVAAEEAAREARLASGEGDGEETAGAPSDAGLEGEEEPAAEPAPAEVAKPQGVEFSDAMAAAFALAGGGRLRSLLDFSSLLHGASGLRIAQMMAVPKPTTERRPDTGAPGSLDVLRRFTFWGLPKGATRWEVLDEAWVEQAFGAASGGASGGATGGASGADAAGEGEGRTLSPPDDLALGRRQLWLKALTMSAHQPSKVPLNLWGRGAHYKYITTTTATKASGKQADEYSC